MEPRNCLDLQNNVAGRDRKNSAVARGETLDKIVSARTSNILSEGEFRALALACFFVEIAEIPNHDGIVVDDPVSSLDDRHILESPSRARLEEIYRLLNGLELSRIRECQSCNRLFWAKRSDRTGCGKVCANRVRFKRFYHKTKLAD
jgi:predicted RNA-binding Zn ribbon-like protein